MSPAVRALAEKVTSTLLAALSTVMPVTVALVPLIWSMNALIGGGSAASNGTSKNIVKKDSPIKPSALL
jgi:hypothetical protein